LELDGIPGHGILIFYYRKNSSDYFGRFLVFKSGEFGKISVCDTATAHLIHGSSEDRFTITYCPGHLSKSEIESVNLKRASLEEK